MTRDCYVSGAGWLCIALGDHNIPVFKLSDAQQKEWNEANIFVSSKHELLPKAASYRQPVAVTIRTVENDTGCEYNISLDEDVIRAINNQIDKVSAVKLLRNDLSYTLVASLHTIEWLAFNGFIDDRFLGDYKPENIFNNQRVKIFVIPRNK